MIIRQIKENRWEHIYRHIVTYGKSAPLSMQYDIDINCNGVDYILKVQPDERKIVGLQALGVYPNGMGAGGKDYHLIDDNVVISALLEIIIYQGAKKRKD